MKYLHGEDSGDETSASAGVGILGHDGGGQRVITTNAKTQPETEEAERDDDRCGRVAEGQARADGAHDHHHQRHTIHPLATQFVPKPSEE